MSLPPDKERLAALLARFEDAERIGDKACRDGDRHTEEAAATIANEWRKLITLAGGRINRNQQSSKL